ncbi:leucine-rich repeat protein [Candidatus Ventrimonas sp. KK005]
MEFLYTITGEHVRIDQVKNPERVVRFPEKIKDLPVTELGPYVLADSEVEEIVLPVNLKKIGAYGFYNCEKLRSLSCGSRTTDLGAGLFAGAGGVEYLDLIIFEKEKSCLKELLSELRQTLRVRMRIYDQENQKKEREVRLIFPEFYEESVENTPARILYIETHGCGHRYRYCFAGTEFQYRKYDELFPHVKVQESEELVTELALGRLAYPLGLMEDYENMYREYVTEHWKMAGQLMIQADQKGGQSYTNLEAGGLPWLVETIFQWGERMKGPDFDGQRKGQQQEKTQEQLQELTRMAQQMGDTEMVSWLMDFQKQNLKKSRRRFEL